MEAFNIASIEQAGFEADDLIATVATKFKNNFDEQIRSEKDRLNSMSEKELLIEMILELKRIDQKCDDIARKIVIWSN